MYLLKELQNIKNNSKILTFHFHQIEDLFLNIYLMVRQKKQNHWDSILHYLKSFLNSKIKKILDIRVTFKIKIEEFH